MRKLSYIVLAFLLAILAVVLIQKMTASYRSEEGAKPGIASSPSEAKARKRERKFARKYCTQEFVESHPQCSLQGRELVCSYTCTNTDGTTGECSAVRACKNGKIRRVNPLSGDTNCCRK